MPRLLTACTLVLVLLAGPAARAQDADPADVASPEALVAAAYGALEREPGDHFDWDRFRSLFHPRALLLPNTEQTGGTPRAFSPAEFAAYVDASYAEHAPIGSSKDRGFIEEILRNDVQRYGDVAHVLSTYQKRYWGSEEVLGRGVNSFQLVWQDGRWWIASIAWDEEVGAGPLPEALLGE